jgi:hypothetical protein
VRPRPRARGAALAIAIALAAAPVSAFAQEEESPWPESGSAKAQIRAVRAVVRQLEAKVESMTQTVAQQARWTACIERVPVSEFGDPDRQFGYVYDERDGTGVGHMPALAVDRTSRPRREDYLLLAMSQGADCASSAPLPGRTADPATARPRARAARASRRRATLRRLERRVRRLKRATRRLSAAAERFDAWESCASWVPVTEYGDPDGGFGYAFGRLGSTTFRYRPALAIDRSDWDDPDYLLLGFVGGDRPGRACREEPGEGVD